jgi:hypothetical protein
VARWWWGAVFAALTGVPTTYRAAGTLLLVRRIRYTSKRLTYLQVVARAASLGLLVMMAARRVGGRDRTVLLLLLLRRRRLCCYSRAWSVTGRC